jgi:hypothetical protein
MRRRDLKAVSNWLGRRMVWPVAQLSASAADLGEEL